MVARLIALFVVASMLASIRLEASGKAPQQKVAPSNSDGDPAKDDKGGLETLQGTWLMVAYGVKGDPVKPARDDNEPWVIKGNRLTYYDNLKRNDVKLAAELKVNPGKNPTHIDFSIKGRWKGKEMEWTTHGIYSLKGDELTVCVPEKFDPSEPENRPTEFKSTKPPKGKDSGFSVYVLKKK